MPQGICKLCREEKELLVSHLVSRKLYYSGKKKLEFNTLTDSGFDPEELKAPLLCFDCEQRFSIYGESEVLGHVAPKYVLKGMPLNDRMRVGWARDDDPTLPRFAAPDFDIDTEKFAYFAVSLVWRRAIHDWTMGEALFPHWELGEFGEQMRRYLWGKDTFPPNTAVIVIVCSDKASRETWTVPAANYSYKWLDFSFQTRGIYFRVMMGKHIPEWAVMGSCLSPLKPIFYGDCERLTKQGWDNITLSRANRVSS